MGTLDRVANTNKERWVNISKADQDYPRSYDEIHTNFDKICGNGFEKSMVRLIEWLNVAEKMLVRED